ncbi:unnamed protein product, partial [marine sediment metagenome]
TGGPAPKPPGRDILIVFYPGQIRGEKQALATDPGENNDHQFTRNDEIIKTKNLTPLFL